MASLFDYIKAYGKEHFDKSAPLNEADLLIFARFIYLPFKKIKFNEPETISSLAKKILAQKTARFFWDDKKLIQVISKTARYQDLKVSELVNKLDEKTAEQFTAAAIQLAPSELLVVFMGTDDSASGWREDFQMSFMDAVPAQKSARKYLKTILKKYPDYNIHICGHSKGGHLALSTILAVEDAEAKRILSIHSLDGPGFSPKTVEKLRRHPLLKKAVNYVPQDSIIGRLFLHAEPIIAVKSSGNKVFIEHNLYTWSIDLKTNRLIKTKLSEKSDANERLLKTWIGGASEKQKRNFTDAVFRLLAGSNYETPADIAADGMKVALPKLLNACRKLDKSDRKIFFRALKKFAAAALAENKHKKNVEKQKRIKNRRRQEGEK